VAFLVDSFVRAAGAAVVFLFALACSCCGSVPGHPEAALSWPAGLHSLWFTARIGKGLGVIHANEIAYRKFIRIIQNSSAGKIIEARFICAVGALLLSATMDVTKKQERLVALKR
jgi:hypothetical protein